jgi:hypothetical protein
VGQTIKTQQQLLAEFADNTTGNITAEDGRDVIVSAFGYAAPADPTARNDNQDSAGLGAFFDVGSRWLNTATQKFWLCFDGAAGAAVWVAFCACGGGSSSGGGGSSSGGGGPCCGLTTTNTIRLAFSNGTGYCINFNGLSFDLTGFQPLLWETTPPGLTFCPDTIQTLSFACLDDGQWNVQGTTSGGTQVFYAIAATTNCEPFTVVFPDVTIGECGCTTTITATLVS